jgi:Fur family ferric uptake transcriptional regulator
MECIKELKLKKNQSDILSILIKNCLMKANDIHENLNIDLATIYRNLKSLKEKKIIRDVVNSNGVSFYEVNCKTHNPIHPHFECKVCGNVFCLNGLNENDKKNIMKYSNENFVENISLKFVGICKECL